MPPKAEEIKRSEKDDSTSTEYCIYWYQNGEFTYPKMTFVEMEGFIKNKMAELHVPPDLIQKSLYVLPYLERWQGNSHP